MSWITLTHIWLIPLMTNLIKTSDWPVILNLFCAWKIHTFKLKPRLTRRKAITLCMKWWQPFLTQIWVATDLAPHMLTQHWKAGEKQRILHFIEANWWHTHVVPAWKGTFLSPSFTSSQSAVSILTAVLVWSKGLSLRNHKSSVVSETMAVSTSCWRRNRRDHLELRASTAGGPALQPQPQGMPLPFSFQAMGCFSSHA